MPMDGAVAAAAGPPGGRVGSLIVGAADGLGGKLMRTVSFFGWTLPVSFFGGTAPAGTFGMLSAIRLSVYKTLRRVGKSVKQERTATGLRFQVSHRKAHHRRKEAMSLRTVVGVIKVVVGQGKDPTDKHPAANSAFPDCFVRF